jgi:hypothetical protein
MDTDGACGLLFCAAERSGAFLRTCPEDKTKACSEVGLVQGNLQALDFMHSDRRLSFIRWREKA